MNAPCNYSSRLLLSAGVFAVCYLLIYKVPFLVIPAARDFIPLADVAGLALAATVAWFVWSGSKNAPDDLLRRVLRGAAIGGGILFVASALSGPYLYPAKPNQGVHAGLIFAAPVGAVLGGAAGLLVWSRRRRSGHAGL